MSGIPGNALVDVCMEDCEHAVFVDVLYFRPFFFPFSPQYLKLSKGVSTAKNRTMNNYHRCKEEEIYWISLPDTGRSISVQINK